MNILSVKDGIIDVEFSPQECADLADVIEHGLAQTLDPTYHYAETVRAAFLALSTIAQAQRDAPTMAAAAALRIDGLLLTNEMGAANAQRQASP